MTSRRRGWTLTLPRPGVPVGRMAVRGGSAAAPPVTFPSGIAGLVVRLEADGTLWQDSARTVPAVLDADPVGAWDDASGVGNHVLQATSTKRPALKLNIQNGRPVVRFDAVDDWLQQTFTRNQPLTGFVVVNFPGVNRYVLDGVGVSAGTRGSIGSFSTGTARLHAGTALTSSAAFTLGSWTLISWVLNGASSSIYKDGVSVAAGAAGANTMAGLTVGNHSTMSAGSLGSDVAAVLLYSGVLSTPDRVAVEAYLRDHWGTP